MKLYVFNPEADMALGNNEENYIPPASIRRMAEDLALLPIWYAWPGSGVMAPSAYNAAFLNRMRQLFRLDAQLVTERELPDYANVSVVPWGWNPAIRKRMLEGGIGLHRLPAPQQLEDWRELSARHIALEVLVSFEEMEGCCGAGTCLSTLSACEQYSKKHEWCVFKAPWSGSGKGLLWCRNGFNKSASDWCARVLSCQGFLIGAPIYDKVADFAMEFYSDGRGQVAFVGYSLFKTNAKGAYVCNDLVSNEYVELYLTRYISLGLLVKIRGHLQEQLSAIYVGYAGYLGVDMMVCCTEDVRSFAVFPCVEINMRMNMGVVSRIFFDRFMEPSATGMFCIEAFATPAALQEAHEEDRQGFPAVVHNGKLQSGYLPLVPVTPKSRYRAYVRVGEW